MARLIAPLIAVFCIGSVLSFVLAWHFANGIFDAWLRDSADSLAAQVHNARSAHDLTLPRSAIELLTFDALDKVYFRVADAQSGLVAGTSHLGVVPADAHPDNTGIFYDTTVNTLPVRVAVAKVLDGKGEIYTIQVAETFKKRNQILNRLLLTFIIPQLMLIALATLIVNSGLAGALAPLKRIENDLASRQGTSALPLPLPEHGVPREIQSVVHRFNELLGRVEQLLASQQRFIADAAHQLRTPLTALKLNATEALQATTLAEAIESVQRLLNTADKAVRLSNQLLSLARTEQARAMECGRELIDLNILAREVGSDWVPLAIDSGVDLELLTGAVPCMLHANPVSLREALSNLLDNALKYGSQGKRIRIVVNSEPNPSITVEDAGPGISVTERAFVTQRFYRGDQNSSEGSGLGLAIVKEICDHENAALYLMESSLGGLRVTLDFAPEARTHKSTLA